MPVSKSKSPYRQFINANAEKLQTDMQADLDAKEVVRQELVTAAVNDFYKYILEGAVDPTQYQNETYRDEKYARQDKPSETEEALLKQFKNKSKKGSKILNKEEFEKIRENILTSLDSAITANLFGKVGLETTYFKRDTTVKFTTKKKWDALAVELEPTALDLNKDADKHYLHTGDRPNADYILSAAELAFGIKFVGTYGGKPGGASVAEKDSLPKPPKLPEQYKYLIAVNTNEKVEPKDYPLIKFLESFQNTFAYKATRLWDGKLVSSQDAMEFGEGSNFQWKTPAELAAENSNEILEQQKKFAETRIGKGLMSIPSVND